MSAAPRRCPTREQRRADALLIADCDEMREGMRVAGCEFPLVETDRPENADFSRGVPVLWHYRGSARRPFTRDAMGSFRFHGSSCSSSVARARSLRSCPRSTHRSRGGN